MSSESPILERTLATLSPLPKGAVQFWRTLAGLAPMSHDAHRIFTELGIPLTTGVSRFQRASLPSAKSYLNWFRFMLLSRLLREEGCRAEEAAWRMGFASRSSLSRHLRTTLGMEIAEFRSRMDFGTLWTRFQREMLLPYAETWHQFDPTSPAGRAGDSTRDDRFERSARTGYGGPSGVPPLARGQ